MPWRARLSINYVADQLKKCSTLKQLEAWYGLLLKNNAAQDCFLMNQYITACSNLHSLDSAIFAFAQMESPNVFVYNAAIGAFVNCYCPLEGLRYYVLMLRNGVPPSTYTFPVVIKSCRELSFEEFGECVHAEVLKIGFGLHVHVQTALVDFYSSLGRVVESRKVFDEMPEKDGFAWSVMISAHSRAGDMNSAREVFDEMPEKTSVSWNSIIHGYAETGDVESAEALFRRMIKRNVISWTTMITCYYKHKRYGEALELFDEMTGVGIRPDEVTMSSVISACAHFGALDRGKEMHSYVLQAGYNIDVYLGSSLIDMYAKCGSLERALMVFFKLPKKNIVCWCSIIDGLAFHGYAEEALAMFDKMEKEKIKPNSAVFVSVLTACAHSGMVEEGKRRFLEMTDKYSILPKIEHYGCMIDLLCRGGLLEEAVGMIGSMRMEPNAVIWGTLLGGCKLHKNLEVAQIAVERLMVLEAGKSGYYALLINMFAEANRWRDVARYRAMMRERGVEKTSPGISWIEVKEKMHQFAASDNYHPASKQIFSVLHVLDSQLKLFGHTPYLEFVLQ